MPTQQQEIEFGDLLNRNSQIINSICLRYCGGNDPETGLWSETYRINVTDDERRMLRLSQSGFSAKEIASIMSKSADTINFYRKCVYEKLDVKNIAEAVAHASHYGII